MKAKVAKQSINEVEEFKGLTIEEIVEGDEEDEAAE